MFNRFLRSLAFSFIAITSLNGFGQTPSSAYDQGVQAYQAGDYELARQQWQAASDQNNLNAMFNLGVLYANGIGGKQELSRAIKLYRQAAEAGLAAAQHNLGLAYYQSNGVSQDFEAAKDWWTKAAQQDHPQAQFNLAAMLWNGGEVTQDKPTAIKWFRASAKAGDEQAQAFVDDLFETLSHDVPSDEKPTESTNNESTDQATESTLDLANTELYLAGKQAFDDTDYVTAHDRWIKAADNNHAGAQYYLGYMLEKGLGVSADPNKALKWFQLSADNGQPQAQYQLATFYLEGMTVERNKTLALFWMQSAADNGDLRAKDFMEQQR